MPITEPNYRTHQFSKASKTYDSASTLQLGMAKKLMALLPPSLEFNRVLEMGCGTGHLTSLLLQKKIETVFITDASPSMLSVCEKKISSLKKEDTQLKLLTLDAQKSFPIKSLDLICSNALVQWVEDMKTHVLHIKNGLKTGGLYLFSGFAKDNFVELNTLLSQQPFSITETPGHPLEAVCQVLGDTDFQIIHQSQETKVEVYPHTKAFLKSLKAVGATGNNKANMTLGKLRLLCERYDKVAQVEGGVKVTWRPWFILAKKV